jgi:hypothetical protein
MIGLLWWLDNGLGLCVGRGSILFGAKFTTHLEEYIQYGYSFSSASSS